MIDGIDDSMAPALAHAETPAGTPVVGIIGGSGLLQLAGLTDVQRRVMRTPWGQPSGALSFGRLAGVPVVFLARHGYGHTIAPQDINYRANVWALREAGASRLIACSAVGGIREDLVPGSLVTPDQIIDYTWGRAVSYFTGEDQPVVHVDVSQPYDESLRQRLMAAADAVGQPLVREGCYGCTQGPRLETLAEVRRFQRDGCDMLGMTAMPEAALARELDLPYAMLAIVANRAGQPLAQGTRAEAGGDLAAQVSAVLTEAMPGLLRVLTQAVTSLA